MPVLLSSVVLCNLPNFLNNYGKSDSAIPMPVSSTLTWRIDSLQLYRVFKIILPESVNFKAFLIRFMRS